MKKQPAARSGPTETMRNGLRRVSPFGRSRSIRAILAPEQGDASVDLTLAADRRYTATLRVGSLPAMARMLLVAAGFEATENGVAMTRRGQVGTP